MIYNPTIGEVFALVKLKMHFRYFYNSEINMVNAINPSSRFYKFYIIEESFNVWF